MMLNQAIELFIFLLGFLLPMRQRANATLNTFINAFFN